MLEAFRAIEDPFGVEFLNKHISSTSFHEDMLDTSNTNKDESEKIIMDYTPNPSNQSNPTKTVEISGYTKFSYD